MSGTTTGQEKLAGIALAVENGAKPELITVRELLLWFGAQRRGYWITDDIRACLTEVNLITRPDFQWAYIDEPIEFVKRKRGKASKDERPDPTNRIGQLASANRAPIAVTRDDTVERAVTLMLANDFSQLPVMTGDRNVDGVISWRSLGSKLALKQECERVRDCMVPHREIYSDESLLSAIAPIVENEYVLVRDARNQISGIVTTSDLSVQFKQLGEPFLLIGEFENHIRRVLQGKFTAAQLEGAKDPGDEGRQIRGVADLTMGECKRLMENPKSWGKLKLAVDRKEFIERLEKVKTIRNDIMHFDPDGITDDDMDYLRGSARFLQKLAALGAS